MIAELCSETNLDAHVIHGCLLQLETSGYVRQISRPVDIRNRVWEASHDFVARLLGPILRNPFRPFWERFRRLFYPISAGVWVLAAGSLIFAGPWLDRKAAELELERTYEFSIQESAYGYILKEDSGVFDFSDNDLPTAAAYLRKLDPIILDLHGCERLTNVDGLKDLKNLREVYLNGCTSLTSVDGLKDLKNLQKLDLSGCQSLRSVDGLKDLKNLQNLNLSQCESLTNVDGLKDLKNLQGLNLEKCTSLSEDARRNLHEQLAQIEIIDSY